MSAKSIVNGVLGGVAGGLVFGALMVPMGTLPMIGQMIGHPSAIVGFLVHMVNSVIIGAGFGAVVGRFAAPLLGGFSAGVVYGGLWWLLGPLTLMPLFMGMGLGVNWNPAAMAAMLPSLFGHLVYGAFLGVSYSWLQRRTGSFGGLRRRDVPAAESH